MADRQKLDIYDLRSCKSWTPPSKISLKTIVLWSATHEHHPRSKACAVRLIFEESGDEPLRKRAKLARGSSGSMAGIVHQIWRVFTESGTTRGMGEYDHAVR